MKDLNELSTEELRKVLADRDKKEKAQKKQAKVAYEKRKDQNIEGLMEEGRELFLALQRFKDKAHAIMDAQAIDLKEYGSIRSDSKGGFTITHSDGQQRITRRRDTDPVWDERAEKAVSLIKDFLFSTVKKRDAVLFELLIGFLERNDAGDLEYAEVMKLIAHEGSFDDPRWREGLRLIKEGYSIAFKAYSYDFKTKNPTGKWQRLNLNFASL